MSERFVNLPPAELVERAAARGEGRLAAGGPLVTRTGKYTGRSPRDRFVVREPSSGAAVGWGATNQPVEPAVFDRLKAKIEQYHKGRDLFLQDAYVCADPDHRATLRLVTETAWHAFFASCLFRRYARGETPPAEPQWMILHAPHLKLDPAVDGSNSEMMVAIHLAAKTILIAGTEYAGEIKKSIFSVMNYQLPAAGVFPMHCAANVGPDGDSALFFGLSGTGKTTLSADPERDLIGDDEHGWSASGVFNLEGGCYAKTIRLSAKGEPQIWNALHFGSVLENVVLDPATRDPDFADDSLTENCRAAYPLEFIPHYERSGVGGHPKNIFFLTCDAYGVMPPLSKLTPEQAMYYFLSGYTAKVAGTETGVTEPKATFSACFGEPFLPLPPMRYAEMLRDRMRDHAADVWLVNTGWTGGPYGTGERISLKHTRALLHAALDGKLTGASYTPDPVFGVAVPDACPGVPDELLRPRGTWADPAAYDAKAKHLVGLFAENFKRYAADADPAVRAAGPS